MPRYGGQIVDEGLRATPIPTRRRRTPPPGPPAPPPTAPKPPDYLALIKATPAYQSWLASRNSRIGGLATDRATAIRQLALSFGGLPGGFKDAFGDLTPADLAAAQGNQFSVSKNISREDAAAREAMHRQLAARGMLQSGDLGYGEGQADLARGQAEQGAASDFLGQLNAALSGYTGGAGAINAEESGLIAQLLPTIMQLYPTPPPGPPVPPPPAPPPPGGYRARQLPARRRFGPSGGTVRYVPPRRP